MDAIVSLLNSGDETRRQWGESISRSLTSDEDSSAAIRLLSILSQPATRSSGEEILRMLHADSREQEELARNFLSVFTLRDDEMGRLATIVSNPRYRTAARELVRMTADFEDQPRQALARALLTLLNNPATRIEGQRLLDLINVESSQPAAIRQLLRHRPVFSRGGIA